MAMVKAIQKSFFKKIIDFLWKNRFLILVLVLSIPTFKGIIRPGYFSMHDDMQAMRIYQMDKCFQDGQIPCRWVPDMGYQYGYPQFNYYGPLPYYVMEFFHLSGVNLFDSVKIGFILALLLGNVAMFVLGKSIWGKWGGVLSALLYAYAPYRAGDIYSRGAMGETWGFVFMPLILYSIYKLVHKPSIKNTGIFALSFAGLFATHNITSFIFTPLAALWTIGLLISCKMNKQKIVQFLKRFTLGSIWAVALSAFFLLPVIFEKSYAHIESMLSGYFNYLAHFVNFKQLFFTTFWAYGSSVAGPHDDLSFFIGPIHLLIVGVITTLLVIKFIKKDSSFLNLKNKKLVLFICSLLALLISVFMTHSRSSFIWKTFSPLKYLQFPWRFLSPASFFISFAGGYILSFSSVNKKITFLLLSLLIILFNSAFFTPKNWYNITPQEKFSGISYGRQLTISIFDYLPIYAQYPPASVAPSHPTVINGSVGITDYIKKSNRITFNTNSKLPSTILLNQFDFPGWVVKVNNKKVEHYHQNELGLITFDLPSGINTVKVSLKNTPIRLLGDILTLSSFSLLIYIFFKGKKNEK